MKTPYQLRPHHGLCLFYFKGKGYSPEFVENMTNVKRKLTENPLIRITGQPDAICLTCPNHAAGKCVTERKVMEYDRLVLQKCGIADGEIMNYHDFETLVQQKILLPGKRKEICGNCQWDSLCHD